MQIRTHKVDTVRRIMQIAATKDTVMIGETIDTATLLAVLTKGIPTNTEINHF